MKAYIVWNGAHNEGFVTTDHDDAVQASTGKRRVIGSTLAEQFHEAYGDDAEDGLDIEEVELESARP